MNTYLHFKLKQLNFYLHEVAKKTSLKLNRIVFGLIVFFVFFFISWQENLRIQTSNEVQLKLCTLQCIIIMLHDELLH